MEKLFFYGGGNSDDDARALPPGDYLIDGTYNIRNGITDRGSSFCIENTKGNTLITYTLPAGNSKTIGSWRDDLTSTVTYFNYNDQSNHHILQYSWVTNVITKVLQDPLLNFDVNHKITGINIIGGLLYWTDAYNEPQKINIQKAISGGYAPFIKDYAYAIKKPPLFPPTVAYDTDSSRKSNFLNNLLFQFKYRFHYDDYEKSAFSPISIVPLPALDSSVFSDSLINNKINVTVATGSKIVTKIEIVARVGNLGDFFSAITINKNDPYLTAPLGNDTSYTFNFYNDGSYNNIDLRDSNKLFDNVPKLAKSQELIDPTRLTYGDITEGFDLVPTVAKLDLTVNTDVNTKVYTILCENIRIRNPVSAEIETGSIPTVLVSQPIYTTTTNTGVKTLFGGFYKSANNWQVTNVDSFGQQEIPCGGFVFYLAGTAYYGISYQNNLGPGVPANTYGTPYKLDGLPANTTQAVINNIGAAMLAGSRVFSVVSIPNVPDGNYILRVADHNVQKSELTSLDYQKRSTYAIEVGGVDSTEVRINIHNGVVMVNGSVVSTPGNVIRIGNTTILDLSTGANGIQSNSFSGYLLDKESTTTTTNSLSDTRIDLGKVSFYPGTGWTPSRLNLAALTTISSNTYTLHWKAGNPYSITDHNGFYFFVAPYNNFVAAATTGGPITSGAISLALSNFDVTGTYSAGNFNNRLLIRPKVSGVFDYSRTKITGSVVQANSLSQLKDISVVLSRGQVGFSDVSGVYTIMCYADANIGSTRSGLIYYTTKSPVVFSSYVLASDSFNIGYGIQVTAGSTTTPYSGIYNFHALVTISQIIATLIGKNASTASLKRAGWYQYGIVYYDHANRSGTTNTNDYAATTTTFTGKNDTYGMKLYVPFYNDVDSTGAIYGGSTVTVGWSIYNQPPVWATHYQWVRTKNSTSNRFLQFLANDIAYVNSANSTKEVSGATVTYLTGVKIRLNFTNLTAYNNKYKNSLLHYDAVKIPFNDRVRIIRMADGSVLTKYEDLALIDYDSTYIYIENKAGLIDLTNQNGLLFEVYNPKLQLQDNEAIYWEIGEAFEIGDAGLSTRYHKGGTQNQAPNFNTTIHGISCSTVPATGTFVSGDTYYRLRDMPYLSGTKTYLIEDASVSDFFPSELADIGRPNKYDSDAAEVNRPSTIYYSELYIPETKINNLNSFYDTNFESYEQKYGSIQKLYNENHRLIVYQKLKVGQIPVNLNVVLDNAGNEQVMTSELVLNKIQYYAGEFGMTNPESFAVFGTNKYFVDTNRQVPIRHSTAGLDPISENDTKQIKMHTYFTNKLALYNKYANSYIYGTYDKQFGNYVLSFEEIIIPEQTTATVGGGGGSSIGSSVVGATTTPAQTITEGETIVFDELSNRWKSKFRYLPEFMCQTNETIVAFKNGALYLHNDNATYNNFFGTQYDSSITTVSRGNQGGHPDPSKVKTLLAISEETDQPWAAQITTEHGQEANVAETDFELIENNLYAPIGRDENTVNVTNPSIEGDIMRDTSFEIELTNELTEFTKLYAINIIYSDSERSNK